MIKRSKNSEAKNYIIFALIVILSIALVMYLRVWYRTYHAHQLTIPVISGYLNEIKYEELDNYIAENPNFVLYMCTSHEDRCRNFEKQFRKIIKRYNLKDQIIYLNLNEHVDNVHNSVLLEKDYGIAKVMSNKLFFSSYPSISIFKDKLLFDTIIINDTVTYDKVVQFLEEHEILIKH
ncbi:MAG: DUF6568 family protein [Bacilli bacterium]|jgi:hypothetical protein